MKITMMILLFLSLGLSDNPVYDIEYHYDNLNIKSITYYNIRNNKIELARVELYWINGQKYSESYHVSGLKYKEMLWYENCLLYTSPSPRDKRQSRMPSSA